MVELPAGIWGLDQIGKKPGYEVKLYEHGDVAIYRVVSNRQPRAWAYEDQHLGYDLEEGESQFLLVSPKSLERTRKPSYIIEFYPGETGTGAPSIENLERAKGYSQLKQEKRKPFAHVVRTALRSFLFQWLGADIRMHGYAPGIIISQAIKKKLDCPLFVEEDHVRRQIDEAWYSWNRTWRGFGEPSTHKYPAEYDTQPAEYNDDQAYSVAQHVWCRLLHEDAPSSLTHRITDNIFIAPVRNMRIDRQLKPGQISWKAFWGKSSWGHRTYHSLDEAPWYDHILDALIASGYVVPLGQHDEWVNSLPRGTPAPVDLEFYQIFHKCPPPLAHLDEFLPWAAKEGLLPWSPL
jgi:hypothetical protein